MYKNIINLVEYSEGGILSKEVIKDKNLNVTLMCMAIFRIYESSAQAIS